MSNLLKIIFLLLYSVTIFSIDLQKGVLPFPGGSTKAIYSYYMKDGKQIIHGEYKEFFTNRKVNKKIRFKNGILDGYSVEYYQNSKKKWAGKYKSGIKIGKWTMWNEFGSKKIFGEFDEKGILKYVIRFHSNGKKRLKEFYENNRMVRIIMWDSNGVEMTDRVVNNPISTNSDLLI